MHKLLLMYFVCLTDKMTCLPNIRRWTELWNPDWEMQSRRETRTDHQRTGSDKKSFRIFKYPLFCLKFVIPGYLATSDEGGLYKNIFSIISGSTFFLNDIMIVYFCIRGAVTLWWIKHWTLSFEVFVSYPLGMAAAPKASYFLLLHVSLERISPSFAYSVAASPPPPPCCQI